MQQSRPPVPLFGLAKPLRLIWLLPLIMAMESPGCVMSEHPLTRVQRNPVDEALLGDWVEQGDPQNRVVYRIGMRDSKTMEVRWSIDGAIDEEPHYVLIGYISRVDDETYANLQFDRIDCRGCSAAEMEELEDSFARDFGLVLPGNPDAVCTYMIYRYALSDDGVLQVFGMDPDYVTAAIGHAEIDGIDARADESNDVYDGCVTASGRRLRNFVAERMADLFTDGGEVLIRQPPAAAVD